MDQLPLVSIVVRTVNRPLQLRKALASIALQTYPAVEAVIINDGGPSVAKIVETLGIRLRCTLIELPSNIGRSACANLGIEKSRGKYIGFLDDDDILYPFHIARLCETLRDGEFEVAYSDAVRALQVPDPLDSESYITTDLKLMYSEEADLSTLVRTNFIPILTVLSSRHSIGESRFDPRLEVLEDWDFWIQLRSKYPFKHLCEITAEYSLRCDQSNTTGQNEALWNRSRRYIADKHQHLRLSFEA